MRDGYFRTAMTLVGGLGAGAGLMYLLDPDRGRRRRALIRDQMVHTAHTAEHALGRTSRDMSNRARGMVARTQSRFSEFSGGGVPDDVLVARVRSHLGRAVSHPRAICVEARGGRVRLTGAAPAREVDYLISSVLSIPGVRQVEDWLDVYSGANPPSDLQTGGRHDVARRGRMRGSRSPASRALTSFAGGALAYSGFRRRGALGVVLGTLGAGMVLSGMARGGNERRPEASKTSRAERSQTGRSARQQVTARRKDKNYYREASMADYPRGYEGAGFGRRYEEDEERYGRGRWRGREDRGFLERAGDELRSWFGGEETERGRTREERGYGREGYRQGARGEYERGYGREGYGREGYRGDYERGYGRESYLGEYGQGGYGRSGYGREGYGREGYGREGYGREGYGREGYGAEGYGREGYGQGYYSGAQEYGREGRYGTARYGAESEYGQRGYETGSGYGGEYGYGQSYSMPYRSYTETWMVPGPYVGRGPRGYRRSDERILEDINERLQQHGQIDASDITVSVNNGEVTLSGQVDSRSEKRIAEDVAESCSGVKEVHNNLRVKGREQEQQVQYGQQQTTAQTQYGTQSEQRSRFTTG